MTARLTRLRIAGFKSFAEPATIDILPGLTGVVGPNGCGKSNVVEALRWAMGETSARSLRGGEMDDVIFAGTTARASRNLAEVTITLEASPETPLPAPFEQEEELQVTRRIERGAGSGFRAGGREIRARDVQTLFADLASGARSSGMVSQGRVAALVGARPEERRQVLEEAAGITGLHARRHEAELKLRAAELNLSRSEDLRLQLDASRETLRRQARQAARYRGLSDHVAAAEAGYLAVLHARERDAVTRADQALAQAEAQVACCAAACAEAEAALAGAEAAMPGPRGDEGAARSVLERRRVEAESLAGEAARADRAGSEAAARKTDLETDLAEARDAELDAAGGADRQGKETAALAERLAGLPDLVAAAEASWAGLATSQADAEAQADAASRLASEANAEERQAREVLREAEGRAAAAGAALAEAGAARDQAAAALVPGRALADAADRLRACGLLLAQARGDFAAAQERRQAAAAVHEGALRERGRLESEAELAGRGLDAAASAAGRAEEEAGRLEAAWQEATATRVARPDLEAAQEAARAADAHEAACEQALILAEACARDAAEAAANASRAAGDHAARLARATQAHDAVRGEQHRRAAELAACAADLAEAQGGDEAARLPLAEALEAAAEARLAEMESALARLASGRACAESHLAACRAHAAGCGAALARLEAEAEGLRAVIGSRAAGQASALDAIQVPAGLEAALGAALAHAVEAALDPASPQFWRVLPGLETQAALPGTMALSSLVQAPEALSRALSAALVLDAGQSGDALQASLVPGQVLVDRAGSAWLWDGLVRRPGASGVAAARLQQRNRLEAALADRAGLAAEAEDAAAAERQAREAADAAACFEAEARERRAGVELGLRAARDERTALAAAATRQSARLAALHPACAHAQALHGEAVARLAGAAEALARVAGEAGHAPDAEAAAGLAEAAAGNLAASREASRDARAAKAGAAGAFQRLSNASAESELRRAALGPLRARALADAAAAEAALADARRQDAAARAALAGEQAEAGAGMALGAAGRAEQEAEAARDAAERALDEARQNAARLDALRMQGESRLAALETLLLRSAQDGGEADRSLDAAQGRSERAKGAPAAAEADLEARKALAAARAASGTAAILLRDLQAEYVRAQAGYAEGTAGLDGWRARAAEAGRRTVILAQRLAAAAADAATLLQAAADLGRRAGHSGAALAEAEAAYARQAALLSAAEAALRAASAAEREQQTRLGIGRELVARAEGVRDAAQAGLVAVLARIVDRLGGEARLPDAPDSSQAAEEQARKKLDRLVRERDEMGPVNLRAETELAELDQRIAAIEQERAELETAIAKLRGAIGHLNREGRARLTAVFEAVDANFRALFTRMMGGGRAHLAWSGSDDPLLAGLEIYAEPPGKKLAALSLLSGGEQALTALSLIFAVFRCNPAPLCVLDEVDAPLDDANVDRFCSLLDQIVADTGTRFLVVTHHQLTMSRMDRLFGVTMQERGVSRLLSVDLGTAAALGAQVLRAAE